MDDLIKFVPDNEIFSKAFIPFALIILVTLAIIILTIILVKKEVKE